MHSPQTTGETRTSNVRNVVAPAVLAQSADLLHLLGGKLDLLEVIADARRGDRLGDDTVATNLRPGEDDVGGSDVLAGALRDSLGNLLDLRAGNEEGDVEHVVTEGLHMMMLALNRFQCTIP